MECAGINGPSRILANIKIVHNYSSWVGEDGQNGNLSLTILKRICGRIRQPAARKIATLKKICSALYVSDLICLQKCQERKAQDGERERECELEVKLKTHPLRLSTQMLITTLVWVR